MTAYNDCADPIGGSGNAISLCSIHVDVERSFSQYKHGLKDRGEGLTEENTSDS